VLLVAAHDFVDAFEVADLAQHVLEQIGIAAYFRFRLDALEREVHEVINVGQECFGVVVKEVLPFVKLVFDSLVEFFAQFGGFDL
jgi:hypothetical protein